MTMNVSQRLLKWSGPGALLAASLLPAGMARADGPQPAPLGLSELIVYMADGLYDPMKPSPDPHMKNCDAMLNMCDGDYFQSHILGRNAWQRAVAEREAKNFFRERFGLDPDAPEMKSRLFYRMFQIDPRVNYHVVTASGEHVPREGWPVYFGGWIILVVDPNGVDLGGRYAGVHTGPGGMFIYGENVIDTSRSRNHGGPLPVIHYQSSQPPFVPPAGPAGVGDGALMFRLDLWNARLGSGLARGRGEIIPQADGRIKLDIVSVLTFPGYSQLPPAD